MVPLFYDRNAGDVNSFSPPSDSLKVEFIDLSPTLLQTILFLVLFDAVASNSPGFCNVSFEQPGYLPVILRFTALDSLQSLRLVITKVTASSGSDKKCEVIFPRLMRMIGIGEIPRKPLMFQMPWRERIRTFSNSYCQFRISEV